MIKNGIYQLCYILVAVACSCSEVESLLTDIPRVVTNKEVLAGNSGAIFQAEVITPGKDIIIDHGFEWRVEGTTLLDFTSLGKLEGNQFQAEINRAFEEQKQYEVRAYIKSSTFKGYGEWVKFSGAGSLAPMIISIKPKQATWGDTLTISGKYFSSIKDVVKAEFGDVEGDLITTTDTLIKVRVPFTFVKSSSTSIRLKVGSKYTNSNELFYLYPLQLTQVTPNKGRSGETITIKGRYFNPFNSTVKFGNVTITAEKIFKDSLKLIMPKEVVAGANDVIVSSGPFVVTLPNGFNRNSPKLLEVIPATGFYGDTVVLRGEHFGSKFTDNQVSLREAFANIIEVKENELKLIIPTVAYPELKFSITADYTTSISTQIFKIENPIVNDLLPNGPIYPGQVITIKGKNFYPSLYNYPYSYRVNVNNQEALVLSASTSTLKAEFPLLSVNTSPVTLINFDTIKVTSTEQLVTPITWSSTIPGGQRNKAVSFTIGGKSYLLTGLVDGNVDNEVYEFDPLQKSWKTLGSFPGTARYGATAFSINNKGYVMGGYKSSGSALRDLWEYDPANDSWTKKKDYLFHPMEAFNLNGEIYCFSDVNYTITPPSTEIDGFGYYTGFWKYDPATDSWNQKLNPAFGLQRNLYTDYFTMQVGGLLTVGYLTPEGYLYSRYNIQNDEWISMGLADINGNSPFTFDYGGNGYLVTNKYLYKYDVNLNQWQLLESDLNYLWQGGEPIKFRTSQSWYFGLFKYNQWSYFQDAFKNKLIEFNCNLAGF